MPRRKCLKQKGKNRRPKMGTKNERVERELKGKLLIFAFFFFVVFFFSFSSTCEKEAARKKHLKQKGSKAKSEN